MGGECKPQGMVGSVSLRSLEADRRGTHGSIIPDLKFIVSDLSKVSDLASLKDEEASSGELTTIDYRRAVKLLQTSASHSPNTP